MTSKLRCPICIGTGEMLGGGMMMQDCTRCDGVGYSVIKPELITSTAAVVVDKRSKSYREAIKQIMEDAEVDRDKAVLMFDEEFARL